MKQSYKDEDIYYLSPAGTTGVDGSPTWTNVHWAVETWAATETHDLVAYFVGEGLPGAFVLNAAEIVTAGELDGWLDTLQGSLPGGVVVIGDTDYAGEILPDLIPPTDKERIVIAGTAASDPMHMLHDGTVSFSTYFWGKVLNGAKVGPAFSHAATGMYWTAGTSAMLDDTGDGDYKTKGDDADGILACNYRIGAGTILAGDEPLIDEIVGEQELTGTATATIWVSGVTATAGIDRVMASVRPPGMENAPADALPTFELWPTGGGRYEAPYDGLYHMGDLPGGRGGHGSKRGGLRARRDDRGPARRTGCLRGR